MKRSPQDVYWVLTQIVLFIVYALPIGTTTPYLLSVRTSGLYTGVAGIVIAVLAALQLHKNLSPFPTPKKTAILQQHGVFKWVRHPIYTGLFLFFWGYGWYQSSLYKVVFSLILLGLFYFKSQYEERQLQKKFPEYTVYQAKTKKFFPKLF